MSVEKDKYEPKNIMVTGGLGFIGSNVINYFVRTYPGINIINVDKMDYCSNLKNIEEPMKSNYTYYKCNVGNIDFINYILTHHNIDTVINFAAQTHVDNSFGNSLQFTQDNLLNFHSLLECCRLYGKIRRFIHISTDEVYGEVELDHPGCHEKSLLNPTNPYAATKAGAEFLVRSYHMSFKLPIIITRGNNVYGPYQYPEKLIPKFSQQLMNGECMTIHGKGESVRNFIHVEDVARAIDKILFNGEIGEIYNIGTNNEYDVMKIAKKIFKILSKVDPNLGNKNENENSKDDYKEFISYVDDRHFNDKRYAINTDNLNGIGWKEEISFKKGLKETVLWYYNNPNHW